MGLIVGIDLGTTFSAVAMLDETGRPVIVRNQDGENITASVVAVRGRDEYLVGEEARKELGEPNVFGRFKRDMGTAVRYSSAWDDHTPRQLSSILLKKLKDEVEAVTGEKIVEAVVTIPANFSNEAREDTLAAAKTAGLKIRNIINEPTAAAMYYAQQKGEDLGGHYAVFDLGGGTFDVTIIRVDGKAIDVLATEGVSKLGGDDFNVKIRDMVEKKYATAKNGNLDVDEFSPNDAEDVKKSLSRQERKTARAYGTDGRADVTITRSEFEEAISTHIAQMEMLCESALEDAELTKSDIQAVILAGGSTRIPAVHNAVERVFGRTPETFGNPDEIVALGAAVYAAYRADQSNLNAIQRSAIADVKVSEITSKYFGTMSIVFNESKNTPELQNTIVINKGTKIPVSITETFFTASDGQTGVNCVVTEANSSETDRRFVRVIWEGELGPLPPDRPSGQPVEVKFSYDENQIMRCEFTDVTSGKRTEVDLSMTGSDEAQDDFDIEKFTVG